jgi:putative ABC transport system permease protein
MFIKERLPFSFSYEGIGLWLVLSIVMAALASVLPARHAARISVRQALVYE